MAAARRSELGLSPAGQSPAHGSSETWYVWSCAPGIGKRCAAGSCGAEKAGWWTIGTPSQASEGERGISTPVARSSASAGLVPSASPVSAPVLTAHARRPAAGGARVRAGASQRASPGQQPPAATVRAAAEVAPTQHLDVFGSIVSACAAVLAVAGRQTRTRPHVCLGPAPGAAAASSHAMKANVTRYHPHHAVRSRRRGSIAISLSGYDGRHHVVHMVAIRQTRMHARSCYRPHAGLQIHCSRSRGTSRPGWFRSR